MNETLILDMIKNLNSLVLDQQKEINQLKLEIKTLKGININGSSQIRGPRKYSRELIKNELIKDLSKLNNDVKVENGGLILNSKIKVLFSVTTTNDKIQTGFNSTKIENVDYFIIVWINDDQKKYLVLDKETLTSIKDFYKDDRKQILITLSQYSPLEFQDIRTRLIFQLKTLDDIK